MTDLYLIAHKVRGEPAFDIATRMGCPLCDADEGDTGGCHECDYRGYWWIIPTSGHRAYPWWNTKLDEWDWWEDSSACNALAAMPPDLPDHYPHREAPKQDLVSLLGLIHRPLAPSAPIKRRL